MDLDLSGRTAVVTGASRGIGLAVTRALADEGVHVVAGARHSSEELDELAGDGQVEIVLGDLADLATPARLVDQTRGRLDVLVNNVGAVAPRPAGFLAVTDAEWEAAFAINLMPAVRTMRAALPLMIAAGRGVVVTVGSVNAFLPDPMVIDYGAAKAALLNVTSAVSKEVGPHGVRLVTVNPGPVSTDLWLGPAGVAAALAGTTGRPAEDIAGAAVAGTSTRRFTSPEEVAALVVMLASDRVANLTGAAITLDGGLVQTL